MRLTIHIINHTHWDREWFLTDVYTNALIPGLVDRIESLVAGNPGFQYLLDGQTLIIEDLLETNPQYKSKVETLVRQGNLIIGPYYCQPDWRMTSGEALIRNLLYGQQDSDQYGSQNDTGWLVDTFGHISQAPQLHGLFGIQTVYVWRGVPLLVPYLHWQSPDQSSLLTINLFGGYRNLYGITHVPEVATRRLESESHRLRHYYPTPDIPLFDGYDLEDNPEDPVRFFQQQTEMPADLAVVGSTPGKFAEIAGSLPAIPTIQGELNSGKYGASFPGTLSARTYLKVMAHDCEHWLYRVCEPLAALASLRGYPYPDRQFEQWARDLLKNAIHDCLCGVSIDLVHEKMAFTYHQVFQELQAELSDSLAYLLGDFAPGVYAVSSNPFPFEVWQVVKERLVHVKTNGLGVWPVGKDIPIRRVAEPVTTFTWQNDFYTAILREDGTVQVGDAKLGILLVSTEAGDTYSEEPGELLGSCQPEVIYLEARSEGYCQLRLVFAETWDGIEVSAIIHLGFDQSPLIRWTVELDSRGSDFRVEMDFETGHPGKIYAGMPFDIIPRAETDGDLLPRQLPADLAGVLLGQREIGEVSSFPFHDFVAISDRNQTSGLFARGLHTYQAEENGRIRIVLRRSVEWLTRPELSHRVGDAGPFFYVPDARCERPVRYELAFFNGGCGVTELYFQQLNAGFQNPPVLVQSQGKGEETEWQFFQENLPLDNLQRSGEKILARLHNPGWQAHSLKRSYLGTDVRGMPQDLIREVPPKKIITLALEPGPSPEGKAALAAIEILNPADWRVGPNQTLPDPAIIRQMRLKITRLEKALVKIKARMLEAEEPDRLKLEHQYYVTRREMYEYLLSVRLNEKKGEMGGKITPEYLFQPDDEIMAIGLELNRMRIKRRIFDYVVQIDPPSGWRSNSPKA